MSTKRSIIWLKLASQNLHIEVLYGMGFVRSVASAQNGLLQMLGDDLDEGAI